MGSKAKTFSLIIALVFLMSSAVLPPSTVKAHTKTIIVPEDFPTIQEAIANASTGDTIFVKSGIYYLPPFTKIDKGISLIGQNAQNTIISGQRELFASFQAEDEIEVLSSNVRISGFTITDCKNVIYIYQPNLSEISITNNIIENNFEVIVSDSILQNVLISGNSFLNNSGAISLFSINSIVTNNTFSGNSFAISINGGNNVTVNYNQIVNNHFGLSLYEVSNANVYDNNITGNVEDPHYPLGAGYGINISQDCNSSIIYENNIERNTYGITLPNFRLLSEHYIFQGSGNQIYHNNFINNSQNAFVEHQYPFNITGIINGTATVSWDNGKVGNYWSDYKGTGSYIIDQNNIDHYPLAQQANLSLIAPTSNPLSIFGFLVSPLIIVIIVIALVVLIIVIFVSLYVRHRKTLT